MPDSLKNITPAQLAAKCINQTNKPVFLTGKAGTGKTTFLKNIIEHTHKNAIIVAPTGIAAINAGGVTIHSQFGVPFGAFIPDSSFKLENTSVKINTPYTMVKHLNMRESKRKMLQELELLIIDEVSMLRADLLDTIDFVLRNIRRQTHKAFGGVQVLFIGDLMQLPPVVKEDEWQVLKQYYNSIYFFEAQVLKKETPVYIELDKIYRQSDSTFIDLLNNLRHNKVTQANVELLNSHYKPEIDVSKLHNVITLTTHNHIADLKNKEALNALSGKSFLYKATVTGEFNESAYPIESILELKVGAQIMFIKNDISGRQQYFNGKIGIISNLTDREIEVDFKDDNKPFTVEKYTWKNIKYELNQATNEIEEQEIGEFIQFPIKLAWAITIHKSQGLTFEKAILDINRAFAPGQVYVALSRLKSLDGLLLSSPLQFTAIAQDKVLESYTEHQPKTEELGKLISKETVQFLKNYVMQAFDFTWLHTNLKQHAASYVMTENKSSKQRHQIWAQEVLEQFEPIKLNADKFLQQLAHIFATEEFNYLEKVNERNKAAKNYFYPLLQNLSKNILQKIETIKEEKQVKTYLTELLELEALVYKHIQLLVKTEIVVETILNNAEFDKKQLKTNTLQNERIELVRQNIAVAEKLPNEESTGKQKKSKKEPKAKKVKTEKEPKVQSREVSYQLFKEGKTIDIIAKERSMTIGTIESHLSYYVSLGLIPVTDLISKEKHEAILKLAQQHEGEGLLSYLKQTLGDEYSYTDIRFSLATQKYVKDKE